VKNRLSKKSKIKIKNAPNHRKGFTGKPAKPSENLRKIAVEALILYQS
jgi:hypothetical protein